MDNYIIGKCPGCGNILKITKQTDLQKHIACPVCKMDSSIADLKSEYERFARKQDDDVTQAHSDKKTSDDDTEVLRRAVVPKGRLVDLQTGSVYHLKTGKNTIGRKVTVPRPNVTLPIEEVQTHNSMSREHAVIEVTQLRDGSYRHFLYNWKNKNATAVNGTLINDGERIVLRHGQEIMFGQVCLRFEVDSGKS